LSARWVKSEREREEGRERERTEQKKRNSIVCCADSLRPFLLFSFLPFPFLFPFLSSSPRYVGLAIVATFFFSFLLALLLHKRGAAAEARKLLEEAEEAKAEIIRTDDYLKRRMMEMAMGDVKPREIDI